MLNQSLNKLGQIYLNISQHIDATNFERMWKWMLKSFQQALMKCLL